MKKIFSLFLFILLSCNIANAKILKIRAWIAHDFSTINSIDKIKFITAENIEIDIDITLKRNTYLYCDLLKISHAKRGKRNAYFTVNLKSYTKSPKTKTIEDISKKDYIAKVKLYKKIDIEELSKSGGKAVVGNFIPFFGQMIAAYDGATNPIEGKNRLSSAGVRVYESTPLSYVNKGEELVLEKGDLVILTLKVPDKNIKPVIQNEQKNINQVVNEKIQNNDFELTAKENIVPIKATQDIKSEEDIAPDTMKVKKNSTNKSYKDKYKPPEPKSPVAKKVDTKQLIKPKGYFGSLPDIEADYSYKNPTSISQPPFKSKDASENKNELMPAPRENQTYIDIIIKKDKTSQYVNDMNSLLPILEKLKFCIEEGESIQKFNAIVSNTIDNIDFIQRKYENSKESYFVSFKKIAEFSSNAREVAIFRTRANAYVKYMPYTAEGAIYSHENLKKYLDELLSDLNLTIMSIKDLR